MQTQVSISFDTPYLFFYTRPGFLVNLYISGTTETLKSEKPPAERLPMTFTYTVCGHVQFLPGKQSLSCTHSNSM